MREGKKPKIKWVRLVVRKGKVVKGSRKKHMKIRIDDYNHNPSI